MALITVKGIAGVFTPDQKVEFIKRVTDLVVELEGEKIRPVTWVVFEDVREGDWGVGGEPIQVEQLR